MNKNDKIQGLMNDILITTMRIQKKCPELYILLMETPLVFTYTSSRITAHELKQYLSSIKMQLKTFEIPSKYLKN